MNISAPIIRRPVGNVESTALAVLSVEEFVAETWRQKDKKRFHFSAPIFLPSPPVLVYRAHVDRDLMGIRLWQKTGGER